MADFVFQSRTDHTDPELQEEGAHFPAATLYRGAVDRMTYWTADKAAFAQWSFGDDWAAALNVQIQSLGDLTGARASAAADHTTQTAAGAAFHALEQWIHDVETGIGTAPRAVQDKAPHLRANWDSTGQIATAAKTLIAFASTTAFTVKLAASADAATQGQAALDAYEAARKAHLTNSHSAESKAVYLTAGLVVLELKRLAKVAKNVVPARAALYNTTPLRSGHHHDHAAPAATPAVASTPAK